MRLDDFHPATREVLRLTRRYGARTCEESVAFWSEAQILDGVPAHLVVADAVECINERRAEAGLPPIDYGVAS